jgi:hypothetical protein
VLWGSRPSEVFVIIATLKGSLLTCGRTLLLTNSERSGSLLDMITSADIGTTRYFKASFWRTAWASPSGISGLPALEEVLEYGLEGSLAFLEDILTVYPENEEKCVFGDGGWSVRKG